jgi:hypothetical protein
MWVGYQPNSTTPHLEGQWIALRLTRWLGWPCQEPKAPASLALRVIVGYANLLATIRWQSIEEKNQNGNTDKIF